MCLSASRRERPLSRSAYVSTKARTHAGSASACWRSAQPSALRTKNSRPYAVSSRWVTSTRSSRSVSVSSPWRSCASIAVRRTHVLSGSTDHASITGDVVPQLGHGGLPGPTVDEAVLDEERPEQRPQLRSAEPDVGQVGLHVGLLLHRPLGIAGRGEDGPHRADVRHGRPLTRRGARAGDRAGGRGRPSCRRAPAPAGGRCCAGP